MTPCQCGEPRDEGSRWCVRCNTWRAYWRRLKSEEKARCRDRACECGMPKKVGVLWCPRCDTTLAHWRRLQVEVRGFRCTLAQVLRGYRDRYRRWVARTLRRWLRGDRR